MIDDASAFILAGGQSKRFGSNKALAQLGGRSLIETVAENLKELFPKVYVVAKTPADYRFLEKKGVEIFEDLMDGHHPLNGLYSGLFLSPTRENFICACDMPFLNPDLIRALYEASSGYDAVIPLWSGKLEPLCGFYTKDCLSAVKLTLDQDRVPVGDLFNRVRTRFYRDAEVALADPRGLSFIDIDSPEDLKNFKETRGAY